MARWVVRFPCTYEVIVEGVTTKEEAETEAAEVAEDYEFEADGGTIRIAVTDLEDEDAWRE